MAKDQKDYMGFTVGAYVSGCARIFLPPTPHLTLVRTSWTGSVKMQAPTPGSTLGQAWTRPSLRAAPGRTVTYVLPRTMQGLKWSPF